MKKWMAYWCTEGFEYLGEITEYERWDQENLIEVLSDRKPKTNPLNQLINNMTMRARFNTQRHYELYVFSSQDSITTEDLENWRETDPQSLVDWIRKNGLRLYSDRAQEHRRVIV